MGERGKIKKICFHVKTVLILVVMIAAACSKTEKQITYQELELRDKIAEHTSKEPPSIYSLTRVGEKIFIISDDVWVVDLNSKTERLLMKSGMGPGDIYNPMRITQFKGELYINSFSQIKYICHFSADLDNFKPGRIYFDIPLRIDDLAFISDNLFVMANVHWEAGYIRFYDLESKKTLKIGNSKIIDIMRKFNVNRASLCVLGDDVYVAQAIKPEMMVISSKEKKISKTFRLSPPFYVPMPKKYNVAKYDHTSHKKWMAGWTSIHKILGKGNWLLVIYRWGYDKRYCYELINTKDLEHRFFIGETPARIYDFAVNKNRIDFEIYEDREEEILWQHAQAIIY